MTITGLNILLYLVIILVTAAAFSRFYVISKEKTRREEIKKRILERKEPRSLSEAEEYEGAVSSVGSSDRVLQAWGEYLLFQFYRKNFAGDIPLIQRAVEHGESIVGNYSDMSFYSDAAFELGNIYFFIVFDMRAAEETYRRLLEQKPDTRWYLICKDRIELISESILNEVALKLFVTAEKYFEESKFSEAQSYLHHVIDKHPGTGLTAASLFFLGDISYYKYNDLDSALGYYRKTVDGYPGHHTAQPALYRYGEILMKQERWEEAIGAFREYIEKFRISPVKDDAYFFIGECFQKMGRYREAKNAFSLILGDFPEGKWTDVIYHRVQELNRILQEKNGS